MKGLSSMTHYSGQHFTLVVIREVWVWVCVCIGWVDKGIQELKEMCHSFRGGTEAVSCPV